MVEIRTQEMVCENEIAWLQQTVGCIQHIHNLATQSRKFLVREILSIMEARIELLLDVRERQSCMDFPQVVQAIREKLLQTRVVSSIIAFYSVCSHLVQR
jgi:hypothetical protein